QSLRGAFHGSRCEVRTPPLRRRNLHVTRCPFRKSCASMFWARQWGKIMARLPPVALSLLDNKDIDHACAYCVPGIPGSGGTRPFGVPCACPFHTPSLGLALSAAPPDRCARPPIQSARGDRDGL